MRMNSNRPSAIDGDARRPRRPLQSHQDQCRTGTAATDGSSLRRRNADELANLMRRTPDVVSVTCKPEAFRWTDGLSGKPHVHVPSVLVVWECGHRTYADAMSAGNLNADPTIAGIRARIEAECLARGAGYEIWTEMEIRKDLGVVQALRPASSEERSDYADALREQPSETISPSGVVRGLADRLGLLDVRPVGQGWVGRGRATGVPLALLCDLEVDPATRMLIWRPRIPGIRVGADRATSETSARTDGKCPDTGPPTSGQGRPVSPAETGGS